MSDPTNMPAELTSSAGEDLPTLHSEEQYRAIVTGFNPLKDLKGPWSGAEKLGPTSLPGLEAFDPATRDRIRVRLETVPAYLREDKTREFIRDELEMSAIELRVKAGPGEGATNYAKVCCSQEHDRLVYRRELAQIEQDLAAKHQIQDPITKTYVDMASNKVQGARRAALEERRSHLVGLLDDIDGRGGAIKREAAFKEDWLQYQMRAVAAYENREATRRARKLASEQRINERAEAKARFLKTSGGPVL